MKRKKALIWPLLLLAMQAGAQEPETDGRTRQEAVPGGEFEFQNPETLSTGERPTLEIEDADGRRVTVPLGAPSGSHANLPPSAFDEVDRDGDGELSLREARAVLPADVQLVDRNGDGKLNFLELQESFPGLHIDPGVMREARAEDGGIGEEEYAALVEALRRFNEKELADVPVGERAPLE